MLFKSQKECTPIQLQGSYVTKDEIKEILKNAPEGYDNIDMPEIKEVSVLDNLTIDDIKPKKDEKELADIIFWTLGNEKISALKIGKQFRIGTRRNEIMDMLNNWGIITEKFSNQPREVIPVCIDDLSSEILKFLKYYGYTEDAIKKIFEQKIKS